MPSCPDGFQRGINDTCHVTCPDDFRYLQAPEGDKCVARYDNRRTISLVNLPTISDPQEPIRSSGEIIFISPPEDPMYQDELSRFNGQLVTVRNQLEADGETKRLFEDAKSKKTDWATEYSRIQSEYANYSSANDVKTTLDLTAASLDPIRPKTAPIEDIEKERRAISIDVRQNMLLVQLSLILLVLSLISYLVLPRDWAHGITFLLLCVGIGTGFFLRR